MVKKEEVKEVKKEEPKEKEMPEEQQVDEPIAKTDDLVKKAEEAAARLETANKEMKELLEKQEALKVEETLGGTTDAGEEPKKPDKEKVARESAQKLVEGTGMNLYD